jgi:MtrB/PioB family decaheme-associated outer membrane protein
MRTTRTVGLILAVFAVLAVASPAPAQVQIGGFGIEGNVDAGWRAFINEPPKSSRAKWQEYRDLPGGAFLEDLQLRVFTLDEAWWAELGGSKWGQADQEYSLRGGRLGLFEAGFDWDQMRHIYSTDARFLATETSRGVFTLPTPRPLLFLHNSAPTIDELSVRWDTAHMYFKVTPTPNIDLSAEYKRIRKEGERPFGMAFGSPGNNFYEILEPIDQTIHDFRLKAVWARENWQLQFGYTMSLFENDLKSVRADNPCFGLPGAITAGQCAGDGGATAPATGQTSLPPDNQAHSFTLGGGVNLPLRTRLTGNFSYTLMLQNDDFLPHTINPLLLSPSNPLSRNLVLPQDSLHGIVQTYLLNLGVSSHPITPLTLNLRYRLFALDDGSDAITFPGVVENDLSISPSRRAHRHEYLRQGANLDGRWQFGWPVGLTLGVGWDQMRRNEVSEVTQSNEYSAKGAIDANPLDWLLIRASYIPSWRRINDYNTAAHEEHTVFEDPTLPPVTTGQSELLRKFYEGEFNRNKAELMLQVTPLDTMAITSTLSYSNTDYNDSPLGLQQADNWAAGLDFTWTPFPRISLSAGYVHELTFQKFRSRSRVASGTAAIDFADFDWISNMTDTVDTIYAGIKTTIIPAVLDWTANASYAYATGTTLNRNPVGPASCPTVAPFPPGCSATADFSATAKRMPAFTDEQIRVETALAYHFLKNWTAKFSYIFESFSKHDWRTDGLNPFFPAAGSSIWLGNDLRNYTAHTLLATIGYQFK